MYKSLLTSFRMKVNLLTSELIPIASEDMGHHGKRREHRGVTLGKLLPSLGLSALIGKCRLGLGHSAGPFATDVQRCHNLGSCCAVVRNLSVKAFLMAVPLGLCWGMVDQPTASFSFRREKWFLRPKKTTVKERSRESAKPLSLGSLPTSSVSWLNCLETGFSCSVLQSPGASLWVGTLRAPGSGGEKAQPPLTALGRRSNFLRHSSLFKK